MTDKIILKKIVENYVDNVRKITLDFSNEFHVPFRDSESLTEEERKVFLKLWEISSRYSPYSEDRKIPKAFTDESSIILEATTVLERIDSSYKFSFEPKKGLPME